MQPKKIIKIISNLALDTHDGKAHLIIKSSNLNLNAYPTQT